MRRRCHNRPRLSLFLRLLLLIVLGQRRGGVLRHRLLLRRGQEARRRVLARLLPRRDHLARARAEQAVVAARVEAQRRKRDLQALAVGRLQPQRPLRRLAFFLLPGQHGRRLVGLCLGFRLDPGLGFGLVALGLGLGRRLVGLSPRRGVLLGLALRLFGSLGARRRLDAGLGPGFRFGALALRFRLGQRLVGLAFGLGLGRCLLLGLLLGLAQGRGFLLRPCVVPLPRRRAVRSTPPGRVAWSPAAAPRGAPAARPAPARPSAVPAVPGPARRRPAAWLRRRLAPSAVPRPRGAVSRRPACRPCAARPAPVRAARPTGWPPTCQATRTSSPDNCRP